jgi:HSP20 family molecular chaperone IbpA
MAEEFRDDEKFLLVAHVPGLEADRDISVSIVSDILHIRAQRSDRACVPLSDLRDGTFSRDIRLPPGTDEGKVSAKYIEGVLEVRAPLRSCGGASRVVHVVSEQ